MCVSVCVSDWCIAPAIWQRRQWTALLQRIHFLLSRGQSCVSIMLACTHVQYYSVLAVFYHGRCSCTLEGQYWVQNIAFNISSGILQVYRYIMIHWTEHIFWSVVQWIDGSRIWPYKVFSIDTSIHRNKRPQADNVFRGHSASSHCLPSILASIYLCLRRARVRHCVSLMLAHEPFYLSCVCDVCSIDVVGSLH